MSFGDSSTKPKDLTPAQFKQLRSPTRDQLLGASAGTGPFAGYTGPMAAPITADETAAIGNVQAAAAPGNTAMSSDYLRNLIGGSQVDLSADPEFAKVLDFAQNRFLSGFDATEEANKALFARAGHQVQDSSPFANAASRISQAKSQGLADVESQLIGSQLNTTRDRQFDAVTALSGLDTAQLERGVKELEAVALPRLIADMGLERGRAEYARRQELLLRALGLQLEASSPSVGSVGTGQQVAVL